MKADKNGTSKSTVKLLTIVVPNHRAADRYQSMGRLVPGRRERINTSFYFRYIYNCTLEVVLFW